MDRVSFIESVSGIQYPELIVNFFDQFMVLHQIVQDSGSVSVIKNTESSILFLVEFKDHNYMKQALSGIQATSYFTIYGRQIKASIEILTDKIIQIQLQ